MTDPADERMRIPALLGGLFLLNALLLAPRWIASGGVGPQWIALEAVLAVGILALVPRRRWSRVLAVTVALLGAAALVVGLGDAAARLSLARPLNLYLDLRLARSVVHLLEGTIGTPRTWLLLGGGAASVVAAGALLAWLLVRVPTSSARGAGLRGTTPRPLRLGTPREAALAATNRLPAVALLALVATGMAGERVPALAPRVAVPVVDLVREQHRYLSRMLAEHETFAAEMATAPARYDDLPGLLQGLGGRDVVLAFIESYGISALEDPRFAPVIVPRLEALERAMAGAGLHLVTGTLAAPSRGGQSWLGHGTVLSGLWLDNQYRYEILLASDRETLVDDFRRAGYRTTALVPAITMAWPEGERFGYDRVWAHRDIDYRGPPLNWVTMPDQFTWSFLEHTVRADPDPRPLFAEVALISSHAPWVPILPVLEDWDAIGDGSVFAPWEDAGEAPEELWLDTDRVREHYALAVDYALGTMAAYAERYLDDRTLLVVLGDHQPAPLITGDEAGPEVPVHVIAANPGLLAPFEAWGFRAGAFPAPAQEPRRMDEFRDWFVRSFSGAGPNPGPGTARTPTPGWTSDAPRLPSSDP